jgi:hypothetical protein
MSKAGRVACLLLLPLLVASCLVMVQSVSAQSIPIPSLPTFTTTIVNSNGTQSLQITIQNQALSSLKNGQTYHLYYNIRIKGHTIEDWKEIYPLKYGASSQDTVYVESPYVYAPIQSSSDKTILSIPNTVYPSDTQLDIQVQTIIGHDSQFWVSDHPTQPQISGYYEAAIAFDNSSDWSSTQTVSIPSPVEFTVYFVLGIVIALVVVITVLVYRRIRSLEIKQNGA